MGWRDLKYLSRFIINRNTRPVDSRDLEDVAKEFVQIKDYIGECKTITFDFGPLTSVEYQAEAIIYDQNIAPSDSIVFWPSTQSTTTQDAFAILLAGMNVVATEIVGRSYFKAIANTPYGGFGTYSFNYKIIKQ